MSCPMITPGLSAEPSHLAIRRGTVTDEPGEMNVPVEESLGALSAVP